MTPKTEFRHSFDLKSEHFWVEKPKIQLILTQILEKVGKKLKNHDNIKLQ